MSASSNKLQEEKDFFLARDGQELYYTVTHPKRAKGVILLLHGMAEHSGRYTAFANFLAESGWMVYRYDQRGHGRTPGLRCYVENLDILVEDLEEVLHWIKTKHPRKKLFLLGHSFGGQVSLNFLAAHPKMVQGAILSSPNIALAMKVPWITKVVGQFASKFLPSFHIPNDVDPKWVSRDPKVVKAYQEDRLVEDKISLRLGAEVLKNLEELPAKAKKIRTPVLFFQGSGDKITCPQATQDFFEHVSAKDRHLKIYPGFYHETLNELGKAEVYQDVLHWLEERVA